MQRPRPRCRRTAALAALAPRCGAAVLALLSASASSRDAAAQEGAARPAPEALPETRSEPDRAVSIGLIIGGSATLAVAQGVPLGIAADHDFANSGEWFAAPIIGPWGYLATREGCGGDSDEFTDSVCAFGETMLLMVVVVDGLMQLGGTAMIIAGILAPPSERERPERASAKATQGQAASPTVHAAVVPARGGWVAAVAGTF